MWYNRRHFITRCLQRCVAHRNYYRTVVPALLLSIGASSATAWFSYSQLTIAYAQTSHPKANVSLSEERFCLFASIKHGDQHYMTPSDFLQSLVKDSQPAHYYNHVSDSDVQTLLKATPSKSRGSDKLFRSMHENGILSYTDYMFLLSLLVESSASFELAFRMLDRDLNGTVDADEFMKLTQNRAETISKIKNASVDRNSETEEQQPGERGIKCETTLMVHLFGRNCKDKLSFTDFSRFIRNLQFEALEVEFRSYSLGNDHIKPVDFALIILRHSRLNETDRQTYVRRLNERAGDNISKDISLDEFKQFFLFLNSLNDFAIAMQMYTVVGKAISPGEFKRAARACTGETLSDNVIQCVYALFDVDGDGHLSYEEFIKLMKQRRNRGYQSDTGQGMWTHFQRCVSKKLYNN